MTKNERLVTEIPADHSFSAKTWPLEKFHLHRDGKLIRAYRMGEQAAHSLHSLCRSFTFSFVALGETQPGTGGYQMFEVTAPPPQHAQRRQQRQAPVRTGPKPKPLPPGVMMAEFENQTPREAQIFWQPETAGHNSDRHNSYRNQSMHSLSLDIPSTLC